MPHGNWRRSTTGAGLNQGLTTGAYELQIRLQNAPQVAGSTVQNADIRYAATGIQVIGKPEHSPLLGDTGQLVEPAQHARAPSHSRGRGGNPVTGRVRATRWWPA